MALCRHGECRDGYEHCCFDCPRYNECIKGEGVCRKIETLEIKLNTRKTCSDYIRDGD